MYSWVILLLLLSCAWVRGAVEHPFHQATGYPAWSQMTAERLEPDIEAGLEETLQQLVELNGITQETASFDNTFVAYAKQAAALMQAQGYAAHLMTVRPTPELEEAYRRSLGRITGFMRKHASQFRLGKVIRTAAQTPWAQSADADKKYYIKQVLNAIRRSGADLSPEQLIRKTEIEEELLMLEKQFVQNLEQGYEQWQLVVTDPAALNGMPDRWMRNAAEKAKSAGLVSPGQSVWLITLSDRSAEAVMTLCHEEETRRKCWQGRDGGGTAHQIDNEGILRRTFELRHELATLMGFRHFADMQAEQRMMGSAERALAFVEGMLEALTPVYHAEMDTLQQKLQQAAKREATRIAPWNIYYYARNLPQETGFDSRSLTPWLPAETCLRGMMQLWEHQLGLRITERATVCIQAGDTCPEGKVEVWHPDVRVFEVRNATDGTHLGSFYLDLYLRPDKQQGSWCAPLQFAEPGPQGEITEPNLIALVTGIRPAQAGQPHLLTLDELSEIYHEFGHLMHMLLGHTALPGTSGSDVEPDFLEVPSQLHENWLQEPEHLATFARHFKDTTPPPAELLQQFAATRKQQSVEPLMRTLFLARLDLEFHMHYHDRYRHRPLDEASDEILARWKHAMDKQVPNELRSTPHIMNDLYAASYYTYAWSEALAADIFSKFRTEGSLNPATWSAYRSAILTPGSSRPAAELFRNFMGRDPEPAALLKKYTGK